MAAERKTSWAVSGPNLFARKETEQSALELAKLYANRHIGQEYHVLKTTSIVLVPMLPVSVISVED